MNWPTVLNAADAASLIILLFFVAWGVLLLVIGGYAVYATLRLLVVVGVQRVRRWGSRI